MIQTAMPSPRDRRSIPLFLALVTLLSSLMWALIFGPSPFKGGGGGHYVEALMWCPATAAFLTAVIMRLGVKDFGLSTFGGRYAPIGYILPLAYAGIAYILVWSVGLGAFPSVSGIAMLASRVGWHTNASSLFLPAYFLLMATTGMVGATARALGEEIGWRGFLVPRMVRQFGFLWGAILTGIVWAFWHLPLILLGTYNGGTPWWFSFSCFAVMVISSSVILTWLRLSSQSVWPCALFHASHNVFIQTFFTPLTAAHGTVTQYAIDEFGFAVPAITLALAILVWHHQKNGLIRTSEASRHCV
jgi:uncharacterized protein